MFNWTKELELGIESIDDQHKKLLLIGNKINDLLAVHSDGDDNYDEILEVIEELKEYTVYHFKTEEDIFQKYNYPEYNQHKKEHDAFIEYLNSVDYNTIDDDQRVFLKELLKKVVQWVINHIITTDYMYKDFLISYGKK